MKRSFLSIFIGFHLAGVFLLIHKHSLIIEQTYRIQEIQEQTKALAGKKQQLMNQLCVAQQRSSVKKFAQETLHMREINLAAIKKLPPVPHDNSIGSTDERIS
ncbi:MAG: hypothetical protein ACHQVS_05145 [Candidatus Babeliales bacterium]